MRLCHTLPRDNAARVAMGLIALGFLCAMITVGLAGRHTPRYLGFVEDDAGLLAHTYWDRIVVDNASPPINCSRNLTVPDSGPCHDYLVDARASAVCGVLTCVLSFTAFFTTTSGIVPRASKTTSMMLSIFLISALPAAFSVAAVGALSRAMKAAEDYVKLYPPRAVVKQVFHGRADIFNLGIVSAAFFVAAFVTLGVRWAYVAATHKRTKDARFRERDIEAVVQNRLVNDDNSRQFEMLYKHAERVRADFAKRGITDSSPEPVHAEAVARDPAV